MGNQQERLIAQARLAMLFDTEGYITMRVAQRMKHRDMNLTPLVAFSNTDAGLIEWAADTLDQLEVPRYVQWVKPHGIGKLPQGRVSILGLLRVKSLLPHIRPFLIVKYRQADLLHDFIQSRLSHIHGTVYTQEELDIANGIRDLNVKGRGWRPVSSTTTCSAADQLRDRLKI
jgi:hypothetical protein